jgi:hypothetical protein
MSSGCCRLQAISLPVCLGWTEKERERERERKRDKWLQKTRDINTDRIEREQKTM